MASITKRYRKSKGVKIFDSWGIRTTKITGKEIAYHCPATRYDESDVVKMKEIIEDIEKAFTKGKAASSETIADIQDLGDSSFLDWLTKYGVIRPVKVLSFAGLLEMALAGIAEKGTKPQSLRIIRMGAAYFTEYLHERGINPPVASIDKKLARDFWQWFKAKSAENEWTPVTINNYLKHIKQVFKWGAKHLDEMTSNPFDCVDSITDTRQKPKEYVTDEQATQVIEALEKSDAPELWTAFFLMGYRQGLRVWSEAPRLRWGFVDLEGRWLMIEDVKRSKQGGRKTREMILDDETADALKRLRQYRKNHGETTNEQDYIFKELWKVPGVVPIYESQIRASFNRIMQRIGVNFKVSVGTMRRAASNYWGELVGEYWENLFLGHSKAVARSVYRTERVTRSVFKLYDKAKAKAKENDVETH